MNNEELKKKIVDIIQMKLQECPFQPIGITYGEAAEYVADALIAAGIGDVKEAEHRAKVLGRTLAIMVGKGLISGVVDDYIVQAEKELAEERKDD